MPEDSASTRQAEARRLAAIMFTDIVGFSRQIGADEARRLWPNTSSSPWVNHMLAMTGTSTN
jgi:hypothetical protein